MRHVLLRLMSAICKTSAQQPYRYACPFRQVGNEIDAWVDRSTEIYKLCLCMRTCTMYAQASKQASKQINKPSPDTHTHTYASAHKHTHTRKGAYMIHTYIIRTYKHPCIHTCNTSVHACVHACKHAQMQHSFLHPGIVQLYASVRTSQVQLLLYLSARMIKYRTTTELLVALLCES